MRRVVITGMGIVSPLGVGIKTNWDNLISGKSGLVKSIFKDDNGNIIDLPAKVAAMVPLGSKTQGKYNPEDWMSPTEVRRIGTFIAYAIIAAKQAIADAGITDLSEEDKLNTGVNIGAGIGGLQDIYENSVLLHDGYYRKISPFFIPASLINLPSGHVSIEYGFKGPNTSVVTACATGTHSIGDSYRIIKYGEADIMVAGSSEATVNPIGVAGFARMNALSTNYNDNPTKASRPWDKGRDGFVMGEGAGIVVLEELEHAKKRGAKIYAEVVGYGMSGDANHITTPVTDGSGAAHCMSNALKFGGINKEDIDYVNAHGTSTPLGDKAELMGITKTLGEHSFKISISSTKSAIGHLLGAAGSVEAIFSTLSLQHSLIPPTLNLEDIDDDCKGYDLTPLVAKEKNITYAMSNSFGFGGTNAALIFKKFLG